jgi:cellulose biosynthesis protein BcsQ
LIRKAIVSFNQVYPGHLIQLAGVLFYAVAKHSVEEELSKKEVRELSNHFGWHVFATEIPYSRSYQRSAREGVPIFLTRHVRKSQFTAMEKFAEELASRVSL